MIIFVFIVCNYLIFRNLSAFDDFNVSDDINNIHLRRSTSKTIKCICIFLKSFDNLHAAAKYKGENLWFHTNYSPSTSHLWQITCILEKKIRSVSHYSKALFHLKLNYQPLYNWKIGVLNAKSEIKTRLT